MDAFQIAVAVLGLIATVAAAAAAIGSWRAAGRSNATAEQLASIEKQRWHIELTPQLYFRTGDWQADFLDLHFVVVGPSRLVRLDRVDITVRDDITHSERPLTTDVTEEQIAAQVWAQCRFTPHVDGADKDGRSLSLEGLPIGIERPLQLERTRAPSWSGNQDWWDNRYRNQPLRLLVTAIREGYEPWQVTAEVTTPPIQ